MSEEIGLDFENFYDFFKVIYGVKQFGKTTYGTLTFDEYKELIASDVMWKVQLEGYMNSSFVMIGEYQKGYNFTLESEAHVLS